MVNGKSGKEHVGFENDGGQMNKCNGFRHSPQNIEGHFSIAPPVIELSKRSHSVVSWAGSKRSLPSSFLALTIAYSRHTSALLVLCLNSTKRIRIGVVSNANRHLIILLDKPGNRMTDFNIVDSFWLAMAFQRFLVKLNSNSKTSERIGLNFSFIDVKYHLDCQKNRILSLIPAK
jgi:hypothetical protein